MPGQNARFVAAQQHHGGRPQEEPADLFKFERKEKQDGRDVGSVHQDGHGQQGPPDDQDRRHGGRRRGQL